MSSPRTPSNGAGIDPGQTGPGSSQGDAMPAPGELHIKEKRTWKTWQLVAGMVAAALLGMALNYHTVGATGSSNAPAYKLPTSTGSATTTVPSSAGGSSGSTATTTTAAAANRSTTTSSGGSATTSTSPSTSSASAGPARCPPGPDAAPRQLDEPGVHNDRRRLEHRLGIQVCPCTSRRSVLPGVCDAGWVVSRRSTRD